jgi:ABC-type Zn2+ transport system, periplasmic component/surface adhesin
MSHHDKHDDDHEHEEHDDHDDHHDDDHEHDDLHLELHRAVDELGKYAIDIEIRSKEGISKELIKEVIEESMRVTTVNCLKNGADMIGHTKSFLICEDGNIMSSLLDENKPAKIKDNVTSDKIYDAKFILHVIVHGMWDDKVREYSLQVLPDVFKKKKVPYKVIKDYYDLEKSISHHL